MIQFDNLDAKKKGGTTTPLTFDAMPGMLPGLPASGWDPSKFSIRYRKFNLDDLGDITELEQIETRAIRDQGVFVLSKKDFIFMDKIFMLISYAEMDDDLNTPPKPKPKAPVLEESPKSMPPWDTGSDSDIPMAKPYSL